MKREEHIQSLMLGKKRNWIEYKTDSDVTVVFFMGSGEISGPADGSSLYKLEKYGMGMHAKNGHEYKHNLLLPQAMGTIDEFKDILIPYLKSQGQRIIIMVGHSRGGREVQHYFAGFQGRDTMGMVKGFASIAGQYTAADGFTICGCVDENIICFHSKADKDVPMIYDEKLIAGLNQCPGRTSTAELVSLITENHAQTCTYATRTDPSSELNRFIDRCVAENTDQPTEPVSEPVEAMSVIGDSLVITAAGKKYKVPGLSAL